MSEEAERVHGVADAIEDVGQALVRLAAVIGEVADAMSALDDELHRAEAEAKRLNTYELKGLHHAKAKRD